MAKLTTEDFIKRAREVHGDKYDYSLVNYVNANTKINIICPKHGIFKQTPYHHLNGHSCKKCSNDKMHDDKSFTTYKFISKSKKIHGNKYDYSKVEYKNSSEKVIIICPKHGSFEQTPAAHWNGAGCPKCATEQTADKLKLTTEEFINRAREVHGDKYDYSKTKYVNSGTDVIIRCPKHGEFLQKPHVHLRGGCPKCGIDKLGNLKRLTTEEFIKRAREVHGDKYDYSEVDYKNKDEKVCIICPEHGKFLQRPSSHWNGLGCRKCAFPNANMTTEEFVEKSKLIHGDKYDYSKVEYVNTKTEVCIICPKHGEFWQKPENHLSGNGCPNCNGLTKQYKFNLLEEFESEYAFRAFLENHDINILLSILMNIEPKYEPLKKDIERALAHANEVNPIQSLRDKYSSNTEESDDDDYIDDTDTSNINDFDWDDDDAVNDMILQESKTNFDTDTNDELTIDDIIRNKEEEIRVINRLDSEHLITPDVRDYIEKKIKNDMMRTWMEKRDNK